MEKEKAGISFEDFYRNMMEDVRDENRKRNEPLIEMANLKTDVCQKDMVCAVVDTDGGYYSEDGTRFLYLKDGVESYSVKEGTLVLCDESFKENSKIKEVKLPSTIAKIGNEAFANCTISKIIMHGDIIPILGSNTFKGTCLNCIVPVGSRKAYLSIEQWKDINIIESDI